MRERRLLRVVTIALAAAGGILVWTSSPSLAGAEPGTRAGARPTLATTGTPIAGELPVRRGASQLFLFRVPEEAVEVDVSLDAHGRERDLVLRATPGADVPERAEDWSWESAPDGGPARLSLTRYADGELRPGPLLEIGRAHV